MATRRQTLSVCVLALAAPEALFAQTPKRIYRVAILNDGDEKTRTKDWAAFRRELAKRGLVEGSTVVFDVRHAQGRAEQLAALAAELLAGKPDILVTPGTPASLAAKAATATVPVVAIAVGDPVATGLVANLARPGGNVTGVSVITTDIFGKSIGLLREIAPGIQRVAHLTDPSNAAVRRAADLYEETSRRLGVSIRALDGVGAAALESAFATIRRERIQGLFVDPAGFLLPNRERIVQFAAREKLPAVYGRHDYTDVGGLISYEADRELAFGRGADLVDRILKGARPAELPVEQVSVLRMTLNMKAAKAASLKIPDSIRVRANEVIE